MDKFREVFTEFDVLSAFGMTLQLTLYSAVIALVLGTVLAIMRLSPVGVLRTAGAAYVTLVRNTPLTLIIILCSLGLWGVLQFELARPGSENYLATTNFRFAVLGLSAYHAAFVCEAIRSGVNTIPLGQAEAARSIGLTFGQSLREVILPQAFRGAITPLGNTLIALLKNTTVVAVIGLAETAVLTSQVAEFRPDLLMQAFLVVALGFVILCLPLGALISFLSHRLAVKR